ncbi:unnamed protein product [Ectocarpus sp. 4 AP-2014]
MGMTTRNETACQLRGCTEKRVREQDVLHNFCSRGHAQLAKARGEWPPNANRGSSMCKLRGCKEPVHCDPHTGKASECCSMKHAHEARSRECGRSECSR